MAPTDDIGRIRILLRGTTFDAANIEGLAGIYGWATSAPANAIYPAGGYTVEWDDGWEDDERTRWFFDSEDFAIEAV